MLDRNAWNHLTVNNLFLQRIVTWSYNCLQKIIIIYLKSYKVVKFATLVEGDQKAPFQIS